MPTFNSLISHSDAAALIPEEASKEIFESITEGSSVLKLSRRLANMSRKQYRLPVVSLLPTAYFVDQKGTSDNFGTKKQTTEMNWTNKYINAEEIACIVPIPESTLADADYDIWAEIQPHIIEAFGAKVDAAILFGDNASDVPSTWPDGILNGMPATHKIELGTGTDLYDDIFDVGGVFAKVEEDGYFVTGNIADLSMRAQFRGLRDTDGQPIFKKSMQDETAWMLEDSEVVFPRNGSMVAASALMFTGDWKQLVYSIRNDITYKMLTEGVITDANGTIVHNLAQEDMVALRVVFRMGWQLPNPINRIQATEANRYPFSALVDLLS